MLAGCSSGVYIPRRDTSSWRNATVGGRLFPGIHHRARFTVREEGGRVAVALESTDGVTRVAVEGAVTDALPAGSVFGSLAAASAFFEDARRFATPPRQQRAGAPIGMPPASPESQI